MFIVKNKLLKKLRLEQATAIETEMNTNQTTAKSLPQKWKHEEKTKRDFLQTAGDTTQESQEQPPANKLSQTNIQFCE